MSDADDLPPARAIKASTSASTALIPVAPTGLIILGNRHRNLVIRRLADTAAGVAVLFAPLGIGCAAVAAWVATRLVFRVPSVASTDPTDLGGLLAKVNDACDRDRPAEALELLHGLLRRRARYRDHAAVDHAYARIALCRHDAAAALADLDRALSRAPAGDDALRAAIQLTRADALIELGREADADAQLAAIDPAIIAGRPSLARRRDAIVEMLAHRRGGSIDRSP